MLAKYFRFRIVSTLDKALTYDDGARLEIAYIPWKAGASGVVVQGAEVKQNSDLLTTGETLAINGQTEGPVVDNSSDLNIGLLGTLSITADLADTIGSIFLYMETSPDNTVWPSDRSGFNVFHDCIKICERVINTSAAGEIRSKNFEI